jgi:stage II sporulation protein D
METFRKAFEKGRRGSATVTRVGRLAVALGALTLLVCGGLASVVLASGPAPVLTTTGGTTVLGTTTSTTATTTTPAPTSTAPAVVAVSGHGWGHGLGMSQWGAYGYAKHGWTYDRILAHYYLGTSLGAATVSTVRVLVASEKKVTLSSTVSWTMTDSTGAQTALAAGPLALTAKLRVASAASAQAPFTFTAAQPISVDGHAYRGKLVLAPDGNAVDVIDVVGIESYVKGVIPAEMPSTWSPEALEAQAVASRSYALANLAKSRPFDLYGDTRSQAYGGVAVETPSTDAAADATKGQIVTFNGKVADTLFFSTSGGRTASALEATGLAVPYLVPVADPYDSLSPYHDWGPVLLDASKVAAQLKLSAPIADISTVDGPSGRVKTMTVTSNADADAAFTGNQVRAQLDLNSTWFTTALLELLPRAKTMTYGGAVSLSGLVRGTTDPVSLESKSYGQTQWTSIGPVVPDVTGRFSTIVKPQLNTSYRLVWDAARVGLAKISVSARVTGAVNGSGLQGTIRPVAAGAPVELQQQQTDGTWLAVSSGVTDPTSAWSFPGPLTAGAYRVRATPGHGVAAALSAPITVQ